MKISIALITLLFACAVVYPLFAQTQAEMTQEAINEFKKTDASLNKVYQRLLGHVEEESKSKLQAAQRSWLAYRDAESEFRATNLVGDGTMFTQVVYTSRTEITEERITSLEQAMKKE